MTRSADTFDRALRVLETVEGGWSDDPADAGGATKWGLSTRFLDRLIQQGRYWRIRLDANKNGRVDPEELRRLPKDLAERIYRKEFWEQYRCPDLPAAIQVPFFLLVVNTRPKAAVRCLQRAIRRAGGDPGVVDGIMGDRTIDGAEEAAEGNPSGADRLRRRLAAEAALHYCRIAMDDPSQRDFLRGWLWRAAVMADAQLVRPFHTCNANAHTRSL